MMSEVFTQGESVVASLPGLVWIALQPQGQGRKTETHHARVLPGSQHLGTVSLRVVHGNPLLKDRPCCGQIPNEPESLSSCSAGAQEEHNLVLMLSDGEEFLCQLLGFPHCPALFVEHEQSNRSLEVVRRISCLRAQLSRPGEDVLHFRCS